MGRRKHTPDARRAELDVFTATPAEIRRAGLAAVARALGPVGLARFLHLYEGGGSDYTAERDTLLGTPTVDELFDRITRPAGRE
jgi:hypothetical protein